MTDTVHSAAIETVELLRKEYDQYIQQKKDLFIKATYSSSSVLDVDVSSLVDSYKVKAQLRAASETADSRE